MKLRARLFIAVVATSLCGCATDRRGVISRKATELGWSKPRLRRVIQEADALGTAALLIVTNGEVVLGHGDLSRTFRAHSLRKSFLSALYGIYVGDGTIQVSSTLEDLGIDEQTPLTAEEKRATVAELLKSRSGVYLPAASETDEARSARPKRGSHANGSHWHYNNWDFNALGSIFEKKTQVSIFDAFETRIATPLGMEDFTIRDTRYQSEVFSIHPSYKFRISARDLARFGQLYLQGGQWEEVQIIPAWWVKESTTAHSLTKRKGTKSGYGYMFWIAAADEPVARGIPRGAITASGTGGQRLVVLPSIDTVVVHLIDTELFGGPRVRSSEFDGLLRTILHACDRSAR